MSWVDVRMVGNNPRGRGRVRGGGRGRPRVVLSDDIRATVIDHVLVHGMTMREAGRNIIGQRAIVGVPGQRGGNVTLCAAISNHGVLHHHATLGPYNTEHLLTFLGGLWDVLLTVFFKC